MDKFAIDLDKVLDDFEESEDRAVQLDQKTVTKDDLLLKNNLECVQNFSFDNKLYISNNVCDYQQLYKDHSEKLDLSEADFASALKPSTLLSLPIHHHNSLSQVDIKTKSFQKNQEKTHLNNENFSDFNRWTKDLKDVSITNFPENTNDSDKYFTNGYVQNEEMLCISVQNTSNDSNSSFSSSDIKIQLLPSHPNENFKQDSNQNENMQNSSKENNCTLINENHSCKSVDSNFNNIDNSQESKIDVLKESNIDGCKEKNYTEDENLSDQKKILIMEENIKLQTELNLQCKLNSTEIVESKDKTESFLTENVDEKRTVNSYSNEIQDEMINENNNKNLDSSLQSHNLKQNAIKNSVLAVGFKDVETDNENDVSIDEVDNYLQDVLNDTSTGSTNEKAESFSENDNNEQKMESNEISDQNIKEEEKVDHCEKFIDKTEKNIISKTSNLCNILKDNIENESSPEIKDIINENKDLHYNDEMGAKPKFMEFNTFESDDSYSKSDKELFNAEMSANTVADIEINQNHFDQELSEKSVSSLDLNADDKNIEKKISVQQRVEICQTYDKNGNLTNNVEELTSSAVLGNNSLDEQNIPMPPARLPRPTTLNLPVRVSMRPQVPTDLENLSNDKTSESIENDDNETNSQTINTRSIEERVSINEEEQKLGKIKPFWVPDTEASNCMHCDVKFTVIKRRHHCRACGKVLCSQCCNQKTRLPHLDNKEARVCQHCLAVLVRVQEWERLSNNNTPSSPSSGGSSPSLTPSLQNGSNSPGIISNNQENLGWWPPNPNNPQEYCSTISPLQQAQPYLNCPPPTVLVPIGVLKRGDKPKGEPKQVMFSDGIRPGGDLTDQSEISDHPPPYRRQGRVQRRVEKTTTVDNNSQNLTITPSGRKHKASHLKSRTKRVIVCDSDGPLSPILLPPELNSEGKPDIEKLINWLADEQSRPIVFALTKNLHVLAKIVTLDCCIGKECWCFTSKGLNNVGQDEVMVIIERLSNENSIPRDIFRLFNLLYDNASKGLTVGNLGHLLFPEGILGSREHSGFLFVRHTFQCLGKLILPSAPFLIALLIQKWEVPWVKVFPLRLMLRLGAEFRYYPCPLISVRYRKPVYCEIGHTIMNLLADFRNYQFTIPMIPGVFIHMEEKNTTVNFPRNTYEKVMKVLNNTHDHVLALASNFSSEADSHLVCVQNEDGNYQTQAINIQNTPRRVTGSSFIVFSGALKASTGLTAKSSIVEDGLLVQIPSDTMSDLKNALRDMKDFTIGCGLSNAQQPEVILLQWTKEDKLFNIGVRSPIDNRSLEGVQSIRIHTGTDYAGEYHLLRWTEVFFLQMDESGTKQQTEPADPSRLAEAVAQACCQALTPHLEWLAEAELTKIGLRVTLDADKVGYDIGAAGEPLPSMYMNALDSALIPVITCASTSNHENPIVLELIFHILLK